MGQFLTHFGFVTAILTVCNVVADAHAQEGGAIQVSTDATGCYYKTPLPTKKVWAFLAPDDDGAKELVQEILSAHGIYGEPNFELRRARKFGTPAKAEMGPDQKRRLIYDADLVVPLVDKSRSGERWKVIGVFAHEIGHHFHAHWSKGATADPQKMEIDADLFAGHTLYIMGASLAQAKECVVEYGDDEGSATHPDKETRLLAIETGWKDAEKKSPRPDPDAPKVRKKEKPADDDPDADTDRRSRKPVTPPKPQTLGTCSFFNEPFITYIADTNGVVVGVGPQGSRACAKLQPSRSFGFLYDYCTPTGVPLYAIDAMGNIVAPGPFGATVVGRFVRQ